MIKAYLRYLGAFLAVHLIVGWIEFGLRDRFGDPAEFLFAWLFFFGGLAWMLATTTAVPSLLLLLDRLPRGPEGGKGSVLRPALWGVVVGLLNVVVWSAILGHVGVAYWLVRIAPVATILALAVAAIWSARPRYSPSPRYLLAGWATLLIGVLGYRVVIPWAAPAFAYEHFGLSVANPIAVDVLRQTHPGDSAAVLARKLPGFVDERTLAGEESSIGGLLGSGFNFRISYRAGLVDSIEVSGALDE